MKWLIFVRSHCIPKEKVDILPFPGQTPKSMLIAVVMAQVKIRVEFQTKRKLVVSYMYAKNQHPVQVEQTNAIRICACSTAVMLVRTVLVFPVFH